MFLSKISHRFSLKSDNDRRQIHSPERYSCLLAADTGRLDVCGKVVQQASRMRTGTPAAALSLYPAEWPYLGS